MLDREFPRAVLHCLTRANESLHSISGTYTGSYCNPAEQRLGQLRAELAYTQAEDVISSGLHEFVDNLQTRLNLVGDAIHECFFAMRPVEMVRRGTVSQLRHEDARGCRERKETEIRIYLHLANALRHPGILHHFQYRL